MCLRGGVLLRRGQLRSILPSHTNLRQKLSLPKQQMCLRGWILPDRQHLRRLPALRHLRPQLHFLCLLQRLLPGQWGMQAALHCRPQARPARSHRMCSQPGASQRDVRLSERFLPCQRNLHLLRCPQLLRRSERYMQA